MLSLHRLNIYSVATSIISMSRPVMKALYTTELGHPAGRNHDLMQDRDVYSINVFVLAGMEDW